MFAEINNKKIYFEVHGSGPLNCNDHEKRKPVLFLVHGGPGIDHSGFKMHSLGLMNYAKIVLFDLTGHGKSSGEPKLHTMKTAIEDIEDLRKFLKLKEISLLGFSYGGFIALGYACAYSKNISSLILVCTAHHYGFIEKSIDEFKKRSPNLEQLNVFQRLCKGELYDRNDFIQYFNLLGPLYSKEIARTQFANLQSESTWDNTILGHEASNAAYKNQFWHYDYSKELTNIVCSTLILAADDDWMCHKSFSEEMHSLIPDSKLVIFENCGHILPIDQNNLYLKTIGDFFKLVYENKIS